MRQHFPPWVGAVIVAALLLANVVNIAADLAAMGAALALVVGGPPRLYAIGFAALCAILQIFVSYARYGGFLKWLTVSLFAYAAVVLVVDVDWLGVLRGLVLPHVRADTATAMALVAVLGTTISPYLFFWQAAQEQEDSRIDDDARPLAWAPEQAPEELRRIRADTLVGMAFSNLIALAIMISMASTLNRAGRTTIETSAQAAEALKPVAGEAAFLLFALGIVSTGLLAVPILAGSAAHALGELRRWRVGLARPPTKARRFYGAIALVTLVSAALVLTPIDPFRALYLSAIVNGMLAPPVMVALMLVARRADLMGPARISTRLAASGWLATAVMTAVVGLMAWAWASGQA